MTAPMHPSHGEPSHEVVGEELRRRYVRQRMDSLRDGALAGLVTGSLYMGVQMTWHLGLFGIVGFTIAYFAWLKHFERRIVSDSYSPPWEGNP